MERIPFCFCIKYIGPKNFAFTAIACNVLKLGFLIASFFLVKFSFHDHAPILANYLFELSLTIANIVLIILLIIYLINGSIYDKFNNRGKKFCTFVLVFSGLIFLSIITACILAKVLYGPKGKKPNASNDFLKYGISCLILAFIEIIHFLNMLYLFKLIKLHSNVSYNEYKKSGLFVREVSVQNSADTKNPTIFNPESSK